MGILTYSIDVTILTNGRVTSINMWLQQRMCPACPYVVILMLTPVTFLDMLFLCRSILFKLQVTKLVEGQRKGRECQYHGCAERQNISLSARLLLLN